VLDCHVLMLPDRDNRLCLESVASERARVHLLDGIPGHIGKGRIKGYSLGDQPFVTYVDDDDMVTPGLLDALHDYLEEHPYTPMLYVKNRAVSTSDPMPEPLSSLNVQERPRNTVIVTDHLCVFRRDRLMPLMGRYRHAARGGDGMVLRAYLRSMSENKTISFVHEPHYFVRRAP